MNLTPFLLLALITVAELSAQYRWTKLVEEAPWRKNYNFQMFSIQDTLWTFHPDGNWYSTNGKHWVLSPLSNVIYNHAFLDYVVFQNAVYGLGYFKGNIEHFTLTSEIHRTTDRRKWALLQRSSNLPPRFFYHPIVFRNKLWLIGGEDKTRQYDDIWSSPDGIHWQLQKEHAAFGKRSNSQIVQLRGALYLLNNDVWSSTDGTNWSKVCETIVPGEEIFGYYALVYDDKIWLLGCNRNGQFSSQVLSSSDGKTWIGHNAPWSPRGGIAATVHNGKVYMTGGKYGGTTGQPDFRYYNDVWVLER